MNIKGKTIIIALFLTCAVNGYGYNGRSETSGSRRQGPPPEAYTACEGKSEGDTAEFVNPRGETVTGTCEQESDRLVLRPDRNHGRSGGKKQDPPPEAYTACEGKSAGDSAEFLTPRGDTVTGTCEQQGDQLVLRPDRSNGKQRGRQMSGTDE